MKHRRAVKIDFIRHGQTRLNAAMKIQGEEDEALNQVGRTQATLTGVELARRAYKYDLVITSDMARTKETMLLICAQLGIDMKSVVETPLLRERSAGQVHAGKTYQELIAIYGWNKYEQPRFSYLYDEMTEGSAGEGRSQFLQRVDQSIHFLIGKIVAKLDARPQKTSFRVLVVSHGLTIRAILSVWIFARGVPMERFKWFPLDISNASISQIRLEVPTHTREHNIVSWHPHLVSLNANAHLSHLRKKSKL